MIVRPSDVRKALHGDGRQVSESAIVAMSSAVQRYAEILSKAVLEFFDERNGLRSIQGLEPLHRVTDEHVAEAGRRLNGNG